MKTKSKEDRTEYRQAHGIAQWWQKDGAWHIALPAPDPCPKTGLRTGGYLFTDATFPTRDAAIMALEEAPLHHPMNQSTSMTDGLIDGFHAHRRMSRCGSCYWALYDGTWCQNSKCAQHGRAVEWNRIYLTNREAQILIEATANDNK